MNEPHPSWTKRQLVGWLLGALFALTTCLLAAIFLGTLAHEYDGSHALVAVPCAGLALMALWQVPMLGKMIWSISKALVRR